MKICEATTFPIYIPPTRYLVCKTNSKPDMKKHIAYLCADPGIPVYGNKGASIHVQNIIRAFIRAGHRVTLFANRIDGTPPPGLETVHLVPLPAPPKGDNETRARAILAAHDTITAAIAAHAPYDLLYERYSLWSDIGMRYAEAAGIPSVLEVNAPLIDEQRTHRELVLPAEAETIAKSAFSRARELIAVSPGVAAYLKNWPHRRITTLANGVEPQTFAAALPIRAARRDGETRIGFLGTLKPWHGLPLLVEAFARVHAEYPTARLHIIGDGPGRADLETDLAARGLTPYAHISGSIAAADVPAALGQIDIATAPYPAQDNFYFSPLKIYEYHAAGLPVITSRVGHLAEVVHDGEDGLLVPPDDPQALADAILSLARNPAHRTHLGDAGRIRVAREHSWESVAAKILALAEET